MAIVPLTPTDITSIGTTTTYTGSLSISDTYTVPNDGRVILHFKKSGAGTCNVTIITPGNVEGLAVQDQVSGVAASGGELFAGPFPPDVFSDPATKLMSFTCSEITGLSVGVFRIA